MSHPKGQIPFGGFAIVSCAPCDGAQNEPLLKYPCGQLPVAQAIN
jgi:hypothetical protein